MRSRRGGYVGTPCSHHPARKSLTPAPLPSGEGRFEMRFSSKRSALHEDGNPGSPSGRRGIHFVRRSKEFVRPTPDKLLAHFRAF